MTTIQRSALLPYAAERIFDLVNDIEAYPEFMRGCVGARILRREPDTIEAELVLSRGGITQRFVTRNHLSGGRLIRLQLVEGPFRKFSGHWCFEPLSPEACRVSLELAFQSRNALVGIAAGRLFDGVATEMVDCIVRRAGQVLDQEVHVDG